MKLLLIISREIYKLETKEKLILNSNTAWIKITINNTNSKYLSFLYTEPPISRSKLSFFSVSLHVFKIYKQLLVLQAYNW